jgi:hypothetical protein
VLAVLSLLPTAQALLWFALAALGKRGQKGEHLKLALAALLTFLQLTTTLASPAEQSTLTANAETARGVSPELIRAALVSPIPENTLSATGANENDELEFIYDASDTTNVAVSEISFERLKRQSEIMRGEGETEHGFVIPDSTAIGADLEPLRHLSSSELSAFVARKNAFLEKIASVLTIVKVPSGSINRVLSLLNEQFFKRADQIMKANSHAGSVGIGVGGGLGLPDWLVKQLRKSVLFKGLPEHAGFFFGFSLGIAIVHTNENGQSRLRFEPFVQFRHATKIVGPFAYVGGSLFAGASLEKTSALSSHIGNFFNISNIGFSYTDHGTGIGTSLLGASFPPFGSRFAVISGKTIEYRANREGFAKFGAYLNEFFGIKAFPTAPGSQCGALFTR